MKSILRTLKGRFYLAGILLFSMTLLGARFARAQDGAVEMPVPLVPGAKVFTLWPAGSPTLKHLDEKEALTFVKDKPDFVQKVTNVNNPSIELHLASKPNGTAIVIAPGGGNRELQVASEGTAVAAWLN